MPIPVTVPFCPLLRGILENPREWDRLLVLADWHDERGDPAEALGWRLLAGQRRWPFGPNALRNGNWWYRASRGYQPHHDENVLPEEVWDLLAGQKDHERMSYPGVAAALADAARAFGLAWLAGWRPTP